jgi:excinuclease UvrABC nuclease subunit
MREAAANLEFERAASIRDRLRRLRNPDLVTPAATERTA